MDFEHLFYSFYALSSALFVQLHIRKLSIVLHAVCIVEGALIVFPVSTYVEVGSDVRLNCTTDSSRPVNWQYGKDPGRMADVYIGGEGLVRPYSRSNRHSMDEDSTSGRFDLIIRNASKEDEGVYVCSEKASRDSHPQARLIVTGADPLKQSSPVYEISKVGADAKLSFSTCISKPFYVDHVPVGKSHADDLYNNGKLLNDYVTSGRFRIEDAGGSCELYIINVEVSDAGKYNCREHSGLGQRHDKYLIVREDTCDDTYDILSSPGSSKALDGSCTISFVGHRNALITWLELSCNGSLCSVGNITSIKLHSCTLQDPILENRVLLQCEFFHKNDQEVKAAIPSDSPKLSSVGLSLVVLTTSVAFVLVIGLILYVKRRRHREKRGRLQQRDDGMKTEEEI